MNKIFLELADLENSGQAETFFMCWVYELLSFIQHQEGTPDFTSSAPDGLQIQQNPPEPQQTKSKPKQTQVQFCQSNSDSIELRPNYLQQTDSQNTQPQFKVSYSQHKELYENMGRHLQSQPNPPLSQNLRPFQTPSQAGPLLTHLSLSQEAQSQSNQGLHANSHHSHSPLLQRKPAGSSMLEEAGQVLRQARRRKKVLEHNLETMLKANTGEILHCQLEALAANRWDMLILNMANANSSLVANLNCATVICSSSPCSLMYEDAEFDVVVLPGTESAED